MFKHNYSKEESKHKIVVSYSNWLGDLKANDCTTTIENVDVSKVKRKFISTLISFIGGTFDSFVLRYQVASKVSIEAKNRIVLIQSIKDNYYDLNSFYKQALLVLSWECYFKDSIQYLNTQDQEMLYNHLSDLQTASSLLAKSLNPKLKNNAKNHLQNA